jgi:hypothetical protein
MNRTELVIWAVIFIAAILLTFWLPRNFYTDGVNNFARMADSAWDHHAEFNYSPSKPDTFYDVDPYVRASPKSPADFLIQCVDGIAMFVFAVAASGYALVAQLVCWAIRFIITFWPLAMLIGTIALTGKVIKAIPPSTRTPPRTGRPEGVAFDISRGFIRVVSALGKFLGFVLIYAIVAAGLFAFEYACRHNNAYGIEQYLLTLRSAWDHDASPAERWKSYRHAWFTHRVRGEPYEDGRPSEWCPDLHVDSRVSVLSNQGSILMTNVALIKGPEALVLAIAALFWIIVCWVIQTVVYLWPALLTLATLAGLRAIGRAARS